MTIQLGNTLRDNMVGQYETTVGTAPYIKVFTGAQPAACDSATSGTLLCDIPLASDWFTSSAVGTATLAATGTGTAAAAGTAAHYRLYNTGTTICHEQGSVTTSGGGGDLTLNNTNIASGQVVTITSWTRSQSGA